MAKVIRPTTHEEWLELRGMGIGSSEVGTLLGLNPWDTPLQLWRRKKGIDPPVQENNAMLMGHLLEDAVAQRWQIETGLQVIKASAGDYIVIDDEKPYLRVSPDRTYWLADAVHNNQNKGIVECKTTVMGIDEDNIPLHWFSQLQYQLGVCGYSEGWLAWLVQGRDFGCKHIKFDKDYYDWMVEEITKFVHDNLIGGEEPLPMTTEDVLKKNPRAVEGKTLLATSDLIEACTKLKAIKAAVKEQEAEAKGLEQQIKLALGDAEMLLDGDTTLATWKNNKDGRKFDEKTFAKEYPELHEKYMQATVGARILRLK